MRVFILVLISLLVSSCALPYELPASNEYTLNVNELLERKHCYHINNTVNTVVSEDGDEAFTYRTGDFLEAYLDVECASENIVQVSIVSSVMNFWADTGRDKRKITVIIKLGESTYSGTGESEWVNALIDFSGKKSERSRREAVHNALKNALLKVK